MNIRKQIKTIVDQQKRWGKQYTGTEFPEGEILGLLVDLYEATDGSVSHKEHLHTVRELTASKAREAKLKKQLLELRSR